MNAKKFSDAMSELDTKYVDEALSYDKSRISKVRPRKLGILIAAVIAVLALCGFAAYELGLFDPWFQKPSTDPVQTVQSAIEGQAGKEYTISVRVDEIKVDESETERVIEMYSGSDLAKDRGWTDEYLAEHFVVVWAKYYVEYDHTKTFLDDGDTEQYFYLTQDPKSGEWTISDNTSPYIPNPPTVSTEQPLDVAQQKAIIKDISEDETVWRSWNVFHSNIDQWLTNSDPVISKEPISDPLMNNNLFALENAGSISPEDAANQLIKDMLEEFSVPNPSLRNFTISDYRVTEQKLLKKQDIVEQALALCGTDELSTNYNEMVEWCQFYFSQYPGIEEENMWIFTPAFSFAWTGQAGVLTYEEALEFVDQDGLVDITQVLSRSPEANYYLLVKDGEIYYMRSLESIYAQLE